MLLVNTRKQNWPRQINKTDEFVDTQIYFLFPSPYLFSHSRMAPFPRDSPSPGCLFLHQKGSLELSSTLNFPTDLLFSRVQSQPLTLGQPTSWDGNHFTQTPTSVIKNCHCQGPPSNLHKLSLHWAPQTASQVETTPQDHLFASKFHPGVMQHSPGTWMTLWLVLSPCSNAKCFPGKENKRSVAFITGTLGALRTSLFLRSSRGRGTLTASDSTCWNKCWGLSTCHCQSAAPYCDEISAGQESGYSNLGSLCQHQTHYARCKTKQEIGKWRS